METINPVTGEPIPGVMYNIYKLKAKSTLTKTEIKKKLLLSGITNNEGVSNENFEENSLFGYEFEWNLSNLSLPDGTYEVLQNDAGLLHFQNQFQKIRLHIVPKLSVVRHIKNINCLNSSDSMRYKIRYPYSTSGDWFGWIPNSQLTSGYYTGCFDSVIFTSIKPQDSIYLEIEVTRNNIVSTIRDSMLFDPSKTQDTIKIYF